VGPLELARGNLVFIPAADYQDVPWRVGEVTGLNRVGHGLVSVRPLGCKHSNTYDIRQLMAPGVKFSWRKGCRESSS
jgi:hypothetical protein